MDLQGIALESLIQLLRERGETPIRREALIELGRDDLAISCHGVRHADHGNAHLIGISIEAVARSVHPQSMYEFTVGTASTIEGAIRHALTLWGEGMFAVLCEAIKAEPARREAGGFELPLTETRCLGLYRLAATGTVYRFALVDTKTETSENATWDVYASPFRLLGNAQDRDHLSQHLDHMPPLVLLLRALSSILHAHEIY